MGRCLSPHFSLCLCKTGNELYVGGGGGGRWGGKMGGGVAYLPISPCAYVRLAMSCMCVCVCVWGGVCLSPHFSLCLCKTGNELYVCVCGGGGVPISPFLPLPKQNWL